ncbi:hypothetical protein COLO4_36005 [Corchorus olitorius]|uniref:RNase H type-1 domain-containing protein n=1 Tax=Corchorus olitorius TaxID=93759 RepID=A0A1R3GBN0_9ROSI|nr:hypothetical protein COLO4_36005 [Corchorus olitorius]
MGDFDRIYQLEEEINRLEMNLQENCQDEKLRAELNVLRGDLWKKYRAEEQAWRQKSRFKWLKEGDRNTRFFHLVASVRNRVNSIKCLEFNGNLVEDPVELKNSIADHFESHYNIQQAVGVEELCGEFRLYTAKEFYKAVRLQNGTFEPIWKLVWRGIAPPRVELFLWQVLKGRIAVRSVLVDRGLLNEDYVICPLCNENREIVAHLLLNCKSSWLVWQSLQEVELIWYIWTVKNDIIFNGKSMDVQKIVEIVGCPIAYWCKARWPGAAGVEDLIRVPELIQIDYGKQVSRPHIEWSLPTPGQLKFNVDGAARGPPGEAGIEGILRDDSGCTRLIFSKTIGIADSNMAEILAIKEAFLVFVSLDWVKEEELIIESDSQNAVKWVNSIDSMPWRF